MFGDPRQFLEIGKYAAVIIRVSRLVFLFPFTEASICRQIGEKGRKENVGRLTAQGKRKGTFVNLFQDLGELFLEIGKYEDKLLDELLNEHRMSMLVIVLRVYLQMAEQGYGSRRESRPWCDLNALDSTHSSVDQL